MHKAELQEYKQQLLDMRARLSGEVEHIVDAIHEDVQSGGNLSNTPIHLADKASEGVDTEIDLLENEQGILSAVEQALLRMEAGKYGVCEECGRPIASDRLKAIPYTAHCVTCAAKIELG